MADYSINAVARKVSYTGSAGTGPYAFSFEILDQGDVAVYFNETLLTLTTDYSVTINANGTGSITIVTGTNVPTTPDADDLVVIVGARDIERTTDFVTAGDLRASALNEQLDALTIFVQQIAEEVDRSVKAPVYDPTGITMVLPKKADRVDAFLAFDSNGDVSAAVPSDDVTTLAAVATDIATLADIEDGTDATDSIQTVAGISANVTTVAGISSNVTTVAGMESNISTVIADATDIGTVSTNITNVNTVAGISANVTAVAGDATDIGTVATDLAGSDTIGTVAANITDVGTVADISANVTTVAGMESNISTVVTNISDIQGASANATAAQAAQTAAESARDSALAAYDSFDDRYLGAKASDPALDNDGNALVAGALYFDTTTEAMKLYTGSAWVAAYVTGGGFLASANNLSDLDSAATARTNLGLGTAATTAATDYIAAAGDSMTGDLSFGDNDKAIFGAGSDLQIYHDGGNSFVDDVGTGVLALRGGAAVGLYSYADGESMLIANKNGSVDLYHDNAKKLATTSTGIDVTGTVSTDRATGTVTTDNDLSFDMNATNNFKCTPTGTGTLTFTNITAGQSGNIWLDNSGGHAISAAATTYISASDLSAISTAGVYFLSYYSDGTNVAVSATQAITSTGA